MDDLAARYAGVVLDLDGVCYRGTDPIPGADRTVAALRDRGIGISFATNNSTRTPDDVASQLIALGITAEPREIVTSSSATAALLSPAARCVIIGMSGLRSELAAHGCVEVTDPATADAVVVGLDRDLTYAKLERATSALMAGARYIGTNADASFPEADGRISPGAGAILAALSRATGREPEIAGKPERPLFETAAARLPAGAVLMVGDRIDTDIVGAQRMGWDTALVLSGVTSAEEAATAGATYVLDDIAGLLAPTPEPTAR